MVDLLLKNMEQPTLPKSLETLASDLENLKSFVNNIYTGKHVANMTGKVERIEKYVQQHVQTCYIITFFIVFLFLLVILGVVYILWKLKSGKIRRRKPYAWKTFSRSKRGSVSCPELTLPELTLPESTESTLSRLPKLSVPTMSVE